MFTPYESETGQVVPGRPLNVGTYSGDQVPMVAVRAKLPPALLHLIPFSAMATLASAKTITRTRSTADNRFIHIPPYVSLGAKLILRRKRLIRRSSKMFF